MAYKQNFGRNNLKNLNIAALTNGGTDPTDPEPNGVVASSDDLTFGGGVTNELEGITLKTVKNTKPAATTPSNRLLSERRQKQTKAGEGSLLNTDPSYDKNPNITQTTSIVDKVDNQGQPYFMNRNTFTNPLGGTSTNVDTTRSAAFIGSNSTGRFFNSNEDRQIVQNSNNYMNSPAGKKFRGSERQLFGTYVTGGKDSGQPLKTYMQNLQTGSLVGQMTGEGTTRYLHQGQNKLPVNKIGEFANNYGYAKLLDGTSMSNQTLLNLKPEEAQAFIRKDSLLKQRNRFTNTARDQAINYRNSIFKKPDLTSGSEN